MPDSSVRQAASDRFLIVGLGNPGPKYRNTRHNIGFDCLNELHRRMGKPMPTAKFEGELVSGDWMGAKVSLLWPLTYMNDSGRSVSQVASFFKVPHERLMVLCDDMSLPLGRLRVRARGSSGGQKGLADILRAMGTEEVPRLRVGIDRPPPSWEVVDFVLSRFRQDEIEIVNQAIQSAADAVELWIKSGIQDCMNRYNRAVE
jgi:peptidyl-tRNA hydrolase, PTH1 family